MSWFQRRLRKYTFVTKLFYDKAPDQTIYITIYAENINASRKIADDIENRIGNILQLVP